MQMKIYDFNGLKISDRNGSYGGNSGDKEGVFIGNDYWLIKYPNSTKGLTNVGSLSYTTSPQSEYIGSHIYATFGYDVHETLLGVRNEQVVVACKDLCDDDHRLIEFRQLKNTYNKQLSEELDSTFKSTASNHFVNLREVMLHLEYNPELQGISGFKERFWDSIIVDGFINNNDRNNGNWGILRSKTDKILAPVYDNGSSFSPNIPDSKIIKKLADDRAMQVGALNGITAYSLDGEHNVLFRDLMKTDIPELNEAIRRVVPNILEHIEDCRNVIISIPEQVEGYQIISAERKEEYCKELDIRAELVLEPALTRILHTIEKEIPDSDHEER